MKERQRPRAKTTVSIVARVAMTPAEHAPLDKAIDALLADLIEQVDRRHNKGEPDEGIEEQVGRAGRNRGRPAERRRRR
jgi:hypothetical protein